MSSPVAGLVRSLLEGMSVNNEFSIFATDRQRERILKGLFEQYYGDVVWRTSRVRYQPGLVCTNAPAAKPFSRQQGDRLCA